jgi:subtilase family serine protease
MLTALIALGAASGLAQAQERANLPTQHMREEVRGLKSVGELAAGKVLQFDMLLPPGSPRQLDQFLAEVYDPASPSYRHFVTPAQFTARFGPSQAAWNELVDFAKRHEFTVISGSRDEMDLRLSGTVRAIEAAFQVRLRVFDHPTESRTFYSPDVEPTIDMQAVVWHISGLDNFSTPHARLQAHSSVAPKPLTTTGACPDTSYCGSDMRSAYYGDGALTGAGQSIGLLEFYGYDSADLAAYFSATRQTNRVPVNAISTDGTSVSCVYASGCDDTEQTIDMTQALGMAPGLAQLNVYVGSSDTALLSAMSVPPPHSVTGKVDAQLSCSWGWGPADPGTDDPLFKKFAAQGQSFFTAAGDSGAYSAASTFVYPADDANVTVVGGSSLSTTGPGGAWLGETAWSDGGGGYFAADDIPMPAWQPAAIASFDTHSPLPGSTTLRNSPDVAAEADFDFYVCADQQPCFGNELGGTSFAAPMWAGYMALANQQALLDGRATLGFLNPALYALGNAAGSGYAAAFHDITAGSNGYSAVTGYDLATGWGSPNGAGLIAALLGVSSPAFTLSIGGPLTVPAAATGSVMLTSTASGGFATAITLAATGQPSGVTVNFSPASITGSGASTVSFQVAANAAAGVYPITVTGTSGGLKQTATVNLTVAVPTFSLTTSVSGLSLTEGLSKTLTLASKAAGGFAAPVALSAAGQPSGVTVSFSPATISSGGSATVTVAVGAAVPAGSYPLLLTGTGGTLKQSVTAMLNVTGASFSITPAAASVALLPGASARVALTTAATGALRGPLSLSMSAAPAGIVASLSTRSVVPPGTAALSVTVAADVAAGSYPIVISAVGDNVTHKATVTLVVGKPPKPTFDFTVASKTLIVTHGRSTSVTVESARTGATLPSVALRVSGLPAGVTARFAPSTISGSGASTVTLTAAEAAKRGTTTVTFSGKAGSTAQSSRVSLTVN